MVGGSFLFGKALFLPLLHGLLLFVLADFIEDVLGFLMLADVFAALLLEVPTLFSPIFHLDVE